MKFSKSKKGIWSVYTLLMMAILAAPGIANAGFFDTISDFFWKPIAGTLSFAADAALTATLQLFYTFSGFLLAWAMSAIDLATSSVLLDEVFFSAAAVAGINTGWGLVRDFVNMFFILILVFLAIATILRINKFSDKRLLFFVIFAALLVNFSKPITIFVIDVSNLSMTFFIDNIQAANNSYSNTMLKNMGFEEALDAKVTGNDIARYVALLTGAAFKFILAVMLFVLAISLIIRIVALWVLIVLSPLAFFGIALPGTFLSTLKDGWVKKLVYWCFFGPILLFFLWLSLVMVSAISTTITEQAATGAAELTFSGMSFGEGAETFIVGALKITIPYIAAIYMLFYGYSLTKSMSAGVGSSVLGLMNKGQGFMSRWGKRGAAVAGTMGTLGLGYVGYKGYQAAKEGIPQNEKIPFTKASRKKADARRAAAWAGKDKQFEAGEVNDQIKEWDEQGAPSTQELKNELRTGKGVKKQAAALRLAKEGELSAEDYRNAMDALQNNPKLAQRFQSSAKKNNLHAKLEYDVGEAIRKEEASLGGGPIGESRRREIRSEHYEKALKDMTIDQIVDQDIEFHKSAEFQAYMTRNSGVKGSGKRFDYDLIRKKAAEKLDEPKQAIWSSKSFFEGPQGTGGSMSEREGRDAMRDMNA